MSTDTKGNVHASKGIPVGGQFVAQARKEGNTSLVEKTTIVEPTEKQYAKLGRTVAALLGANSDWDGADYLEGIAEAGSRAVGIEIGSSDPEVLKFWRSQADDLGIEHDGDEDEDEYEDEDEDEDEDAVYAPGLS